MDRGVWWATVHRVAKLSDAPDTLLLPASFPTYLKVVKTFSYVPRLLIHKVKWKAQNMNITGKYRSWMLLFSCSVVSDSLQPHGRQHARLPCPSPSPRACLNSRPLSQWCHPAISSSVIPFSSCLHSFPTSGSFQMSQFFTSGGQSIEASASASASVLPISI